MTQDPITLLIADDHAMVRSAITTWIKTIPELRLVGEAGDGEGAIAQALALKPDVILMDLMMPKVDGIAATRAILQHAPDTKVLIVTSFTEKARAVEAIQAGAQGFILKDASLDELLQAIQTVARGQAWFSAELARALAQPAVAGPSEPDRGPDVLTEREMGVLRLLVEGASDQEIAARLVIAPATVRFHMGQILDKLQVKNRTQAALVAIRQGWVRV
jgi:two-component system, NarL family, response regulator LiaR